MQMFQSEFIFFQAEWMDRREYWNDKMQRRYEKRRQDTWSKVNFEQIFRIVAYIFISLKNVIGI